MSFQNPYEIRPTAYSLLEQPIYGSSMLGVKKPESDNRLQTPGTGVANGILTSHTLGLKQYQLTNHLGNVLSTVSDKKTFTANNFFNPDVVSSTDYYAFGMEMLERTFKPSDYNYGFNGKEKADEISQGDYDYGDRLYDSKICRWFTPDKRASEYVPFSPYIFALNNPIYFKDADGNVVVDGKGNEVKVGIIEEDGVFHALYQFAEGTDQKTKDDFFNNGGAIINTLIQTETGRDIVKKVIDANDKVLTIVGSINGKVHYSKDGIKLGSTDYTVVQDYDEKCQSTGESTGMIIVNIYPASIIEKAIKNTKDPSLVTDPNSPANEFVNNNLSQDQQNASVAGHEFFHATDDKDLELLKSDKPLDYNSPQHKGAYNTGTKIANEFGKSNRTN